MAAGCQTLINAYFCTLVILGKPRHLHHINAFIVQLFAFILGYLANDPRWLNLTIVNFPRFFGEIATNILAFAFDLGLQASHFTD